MNSSDADSITPGNTIQSDSVDSQPSLKRNFSLMTIYYVIMRIGWIFKTESIVMPAVMDLIGGGGWLRGCLPMLNRFGQSIPPMLASESIKAVARKKFVLAACAFVMGACFMSLSTVWYQTGGKTNPWLPIIFLVIYGTFFVAVGLHNMASSLLQGKLIPVKIRGRFMFYGMTIGSTLAITMAWWLLRRWLGAETGNFTNIFAFTGSAFLCAGFVSLFLEEPKEQFRSSNTSWLNIFRNCLATLVIDKNFRLLAIIASTFGMTITLFPHYQALGRSRLELGLTALVPWIIAQNIGAASFSIPLGWVADKFGFRRVLQIQMLLCCIAPILALVIVRIGGDWGSLPFIFVFFLLGLFPVSIRSFNNYTLEIVGARHQPKYLSTLSLCIAAPPILGSAAIGLLVDKTGFEFAFVFVVCFVFVGWILTFWLKEPRAQ